jgi:predicted permease
MKTLLVLFYVALFVAIIFFGPLQEFLYKKKSEWDLKQRSPEPKGEANKDPATRADPEKTGLMLSLMLIALAVMFFLWKILTTTFMPL